MNKSTSIKALAAALVAAQSEMPAVKMNSFNKFIGNNYADLGAVINTAKPILSKNGLVVSQIVEGFDEAVGITTCLIHTSGEWMEGTVYLKVDSEKGKSMVQVAGSNISYLRRYALAAILGMYSDEDTDGSLPNDGKSQAPARQPQQRPVQPVPGKAPAPGAAVSPTPALEPSTAPNLPAGALTTAAVDLGGVLAPSYAGKLVKLHKHSYPAAWAPKIISAFISTGQIPEGIPHIDAILQKLAVPLEASADDAVAAIDAYLASKSAA